MPLCCSVFQVPAGLRSGAQKRPAGGGSGSASQFALEPQAASDIARRLSQGCLRGRVPLRLWKMSEPAYKTCSCTQHNTHTESINVEEKIFIGGDIHLQEISLKHNKQMYRTL